jgi:hypothetical protein
MASPSLRLRLAPRCGAKLTEIRSLRSGRDWLWKNPRHMLRQGKPFADYVGEFDTGGWDELFPNVAPIPAGVDLGEWGTRGLTDHGELWYREWDTDRESELRCAQGVMLPSVGCRFRRGIKLDRLDARADFAYEVENSGPVALPFVWAAHPLFRCEAGMSLHVDPSLRIEGVQCHGRAFDGIPAGGTWGDVLDRFPFLAADAGWTREELGCGLTLKVFVRTDAGEAVSLVDRASRERLSLWHYGGPVTHTAIWLNLGGWSGDRGALHRNIGIEPTTHPGDTPPETALASAVLESGESREWALSLAVERL